MVPAALLVTASVKELTVNSWAVPAVSAPDCRLCRFVPGVAMLQSAQPRQRNHRRLCRRLVLDWSRLRRVLSQRVVKPILMVIAHVIPKQAQKVTLVQSNNTIQEFTAAASYPTLGGSILPGRLHARSFGCQTRRLQE